KGSVVSSSTKLASAPIAAAAALPRAASRSAAITCAPSAARRMAAARPMPEAAPVTTATLPVNLCCVIILMSTGQAVVEIAPQHGAGAGGGQADAVRQIDPQPVEQRKQSLGNVRRQIGRRADTLQRGLEIAGKAALIGALQPRQRRRFRNKGMKRAPGGGDVGMQHLVTK